MPSVGSKIRELMMRQGLSQRELARRSGLSLTIVNSIASGRYPPGTSIGSFEKIAAALGSSIGELFGGSQPVEDPAEELALLRRLDSGESVGLRRLASRLDELITLAADVRQRDEESRPRLEVVGGESLIVPLYGHAAAGLGAYNEPVPNWAEVEKVPVPRSLRPGDGQLSATRVRGESMEPELADGDIVVLHYPERQPALRLLAEGALVAVTVTDGGEWSDYLKRYATDARSGSELLISTNTAYRPIPLNLRDVRFVGAVKMVIKG
jgi:transcriptional regulator with XRE-family HTH domain